MNATGRPYVDMAVVVAGAVVLIGVCRVWAWWLRRSVRRRYPRVDQFGRSDQHLYVIDPERLDGYYADPTRRDSHIVVRHHPTPTIHPPARPVRDLDDWPRP